MLFIVTIKEKCITCARHLLNIKVLRPRFHVIKPAPDECFYLPLKFHHPAPRFSSRMTSANHGQRKLRILHILRAPTGGLFRHVCDLAREQSALGHQVGVIADSMTGNPDAQTKFDNLKSTFSLGVHRFPIYRKPTVKDFFCIAQARRIALQHNIDVAHGHGSKGGVYARMCAILPGARGMVSAYTPHGGSFHRQRGYHFYVLIERMMEQLTDVYIFESGYISENVTQTIGQTKRNAVIARNGLYPEEFQPVAAPPDAADFVFVGELTYYKGIDVLIEALYLIVQATAYRPRLVIVGQGALRDELANLVAEKGLDKLIVFVGAKPAREAFTLGKTLIMASRAESLPYIILETAAAHVPLIATNVGGMSEIFGPFTHKLAPPNNAVALGSAMLSMLEASDEKRRADAKQLADYVQDNFSIARMSQTVLSAYYAALGKKKRSSL